MVFVVDTSVFLSDPKSLERLSDKHIVIPLAVLLELEDKRNHSELGYAARETLRGLEEYRRKHFQLTEVMPTPSGGSVRVEMNHIADSDLPESFKTNENDNRILAVAFNLSREGQKVTLLTKDLPLRLKASVVGLNASDFEPDDAVDVYGNGLIELHVSEQDISDLYSYGRIFLSETAEGYPVNTGFILKGGRSNSALATLTTEGDLRLVREQSLFDVKGRSAEQRVAMDHLTNPDVPIVSIGGSAGTGKSLLALAAGLDLVVEQSKYKKVVVFRPLYAVGGQDLGFLPGTAEEKMTPWAAAVYDALESFCGPNVIEVVRKDGLIEVLPLTHIRGRTLSDSYVIVDEAQNLEKTVLVTALTRIGHNSKIVLTHDISQRDNLRVGKHDGIYSMINKLTGEPLFAHILLTKSERSAVAELVANKFDT